MTLEATAESLLSDPLYRINTLYKIRDKNGVEVQFELNAAQADLCRNMHHRNVILKARQLGFSTFIQLYMLDECLFNSNTAAATVAHTQHDAAELFDNKIRFAYESLDPAFKARISAKQDSARKLSFSNGSSISVGTSLRSGTFQLLHISEFGKIAAATPEKAREIRTGALNTVPDSGLIWIESTAEGSTGDFYDMCQRAQQMKERGATLTPLDFAFHFYPWHADPDYSLPYAVPIPADKQDYFQRLERDGTKLTDGQKHWYVKKAETQHEDMLREYPSTPDEAFEASVQGAYYATQMQEARTQGRICRVPLEDIPVNTFWDLGMDDETSIWLHQRVGIENRFIRYFHGSGEGAAYYAKWLTEWAHDHKRQFGTHYLPHDGGIRSMASGLTYQQTLRDNGLNNVTIVPRTKDVLDDIQKVRDVLASCWFDEEGCDAGLDALTNYCKEWDANKATFKRTPKHDWASHGADAFRMFAMGYSVPFNKPLKANKGYVV